MDPFERQFDRRNINVQAIVAYVIGVIVAYILHRVMGLQLYPPNTIFSLLIIVAVGGGWYHLRRIV